VIILLKRDFVLIGIAHSVNMADSFGFTKTENKVSTVVRWHYKNF
jgi:hypothetical protein